MTLRYPLAALLLAAGTLQGCSSTPATTADTQPIEVNQVGFLPASAKWAAVPAGSSTASTFTVVEAASGREVLRGTLGAAATWEPAQASYRLADFSALKAPGRYRVHVEGVQDSPPFVVSTQAYDELAAASLKAFYFNRAGIELKPEHAGVYARPAGHPDTRVLVHPSAAGPGRPEGTVISAPKGWYDAGDYNKYVVNSGISTYTLLAAYEHFPEFFRQQSLNIPESAPRAGSASPPPRGDKEPGSGPSFLGTNALPDVLDEALWNLEWMLAMQDPNDGGVYHKLTNKSFDATVMPHQATGERYVVQKTTAAALDFAAVMATASRVFSGFEAQRPGLSVRMLAAARFAWQWAQAHPAVVYRQPSDIHTGGYDDSQLEDEFAWAAAELYISTREDAFYAAMKPERVQSSVPGWGDVKGLAWMSLAQHRQKLTPAADQALIAQRIDGLARELASTWEASPYRVSMRTGDYHWGSNSGLLNQAMMLIQGYRLSGDRKELDAAQSALDYVLGRNALGISMVTGIGTKPPLHPHHRPSEADGIAAPVPGFIVGGPQPGQEDAKGCPVPYPSKVPAKSYLDHYCSYASNEVAINWNAPLVYVSAALEVLTGAAK